MGVIIIRNVPPELVGVVFAVIVAIWILRIYLHFSDNKPTMRPRPTIDDPAYDLLFLRSHLEALKAGTECKCPSICPYCTAVADSTARADAP
jgi:hypothetical protein